MHARPRRRTPDLAATADAFASRLLDRIDRRFHGPAEQSGTEELAAAWRRVRAKPGRLSTKTSDEWSHIGSFMGTSGFGWFLLTTLIGILYLVSPLGGWAAALVHTVILITVSLTTGLAATRIAAHYAATAAISRNYASNRRIRTMTSILRSRTVLAVAAVTAAVLYISFGMNHS
ncbi:hypothetical protein AB0O01_35250 [Streptomyces sp. NPDC093252]|uniref:hypothetical protein n=1 Tax=Streptomyces sp. NPDC093252 TaxID=3154980 RepID=UPI0034195C56